MGRVVGLAAIVVAAVVAACALFATTCRSSDPRVIETTAGEHPSGRAVAPRREAAARSDLPLFESPSPDPAGERAPGVPEWATDDLSRVELVAPHPDELPCGTTDCLLDDPQRHRRETREQLAWAGLTELMDAQGVSEEMEGDLRAQLAANLVALQHP